MWRQDDLWGSRLCRFTVIQDTVVLGAWKEGDFDEKWNLFNKLKEVHSPSVQAPKTLGLIYVI